MSLLLLLACASGPPPGLPSRPDNLTCIAPPRPVEQASVRFERVDGLRFTEPVDLVYDRDRWLVVEQAGRVMAADAEGEVQELLDLRDRVLSGGELGLLGLALHPRWPEVPEAFLHYTAEGRVSTVSRFTSPDGLRLDADSEEVILTLQQPYANHNGGDLDFGPDGMLYVAFGDGGSQGDPRGHGQDPHTWLAAILRVDVDGGSPYAIPADNPFADGVQGAPEVWAYGLRNPWRISFDAVTGELWTGDVGQNAVEEVNRVVRGGNYGWNHLEGHDCYAEDPCDSLAYEPPVAWYSHREGVSVTGGVVVRGGDVPALEGVYIYGDYVSGRVWGVFFNPETGESEGVAIGEAPGAYISTFGQSPEGEVLIADYASGRLLRMLPGEEVAEPARPFPQRLSETGCVSADDPRRPAPGLIPYRVNHELWSDGAEKERYVALPPGAAASLGAQGRVDLPVGSVLVKHFRVAGALVETRLYVRHTDGGWAPYTYEWLPDGSDAVLTRAGGEVATADGGTWDIPSSAQCVACHVPASGFTLGMELAQLNGDLAYPGGNEANQLATWAHLGLFDEALPEDLPALLPAEAGAEAARSTLHVQCATCHQPGSTAPGELDLRVDTPLAQMQICDVEPASGDMGVEGMRLLAPGDPARSLIVQRMASTDPLLRMPPLGTALVHAEGLAAVEAWVAGLEGCE